MTIALNKRVAGELSRIDYSLREDFELEGKWWHPGDVEHLVVGIAKYEGSKAQLSLSLQDLLWSDRRGRADFTNKEGKKIADQEVVLHGISGVGVPFSILGADLTNLKSSSPGYHRCRFYARRLVIGKHVDSDNFQASAVRFLYEDLLDSTRADETADAKIDKPEQTLLSVRLCELDLDLNLIYERTINQSRSKTIIDKRVWLEVRSHSTTPVQELLECATLFGNFLDILHGVPDTPVKAEVIDSSGSRYPLFFLSEKNWGQRRERDGLLFLISKLEKETLEKAIQEWYKSTEGLKAVAFLFSSLLKYPARHSEINFVMWCQALEAFHRATQSKVYMAQPEYEVLAAGILAILPNSLDGAFEGKLKSMIKYGNQLSQKDLLRDLLDGLPEDARKKFSSEWNMVSEIIDTRNYFTHFSDELRSKKLSPPMIAAANIALGSLLNGLLLVQLGLDTEQVWSQLTKRSIFKDFEFIKSGLTSD